MFYHQADEKNKIIFSFIDIPPSFPSNNVFGVGKGICPLVGYATDIR